MVDVLVQGSIVFTGEELLREGYVYIRDGRVEALGEGVPPEDYTFATLIVGGRGRLVAPALLAVVDPVEYMFRTPDCGWTARWGCRERQSLKPEEEALLSMPAVLEAHSLGIGRVFIVASNPGVALILQERTGGSFGVVIPEGCEAPSEHPRLEGILRLGDIPLSPWVCPSRMLCTSPDPYRDSVELASKLGVEPPRIREGSPAGIAVFSLERPPLLGLRVESVEDAGKVYTLGASAESLIMGEETVIDVGEHLSIVEKTLRDALRLAEKLGRG